MENNCKSILNAQQSVVCAVSKENFVLRDKTLTSEMNVFQLNPT